MLERNHRVKHESYFPLGRAAHCCQKLRQRISLWGQKALDMLREAYALVRLALWNLRPCYWIKSVKTERASRITVLVHGYLSNGTCWKVMKKELAKRGVEHLYEITYPQPFASIEGEIANELDKKFRELLFRTGADEMNIVTHSMGGVVSSYWNEFVRDIESFPAKVNRIVMIAPPLRGSDVLSPVQIGRCRQEILPKSDLLKKLLPKVKASMTPYRSLASRGDKIVAAASASLDAERTKVVDRIGHAEMLMDQTVVEWVVEQLNESS